MKKKIILIITILCSLLLMNQVHGYTYYKKNGAQRMKIDKNGKFTSTTYQSDHVYSLKAKIAFDGYIGETEEDVKYLDKSRLHAQDPSSSARWKRWRVVCYC